MGGEAPNKNPEPPVEATKPAETPEAQATREAAEKARQEKLQKLIDGSDEQRVEDKKEADAMIEEFMHEEEAPAATPDSKKQEAKSEGGIFNTISGGLASAMEPMVANMLARTAERLQNEGTGSLGEALSDTLLKALVQISLFFNPKAPWAEKLFGDEKMKELFEKGLGMKLVPDKDGNYSCSFEATLQPDALPCSPANELLTRYLGEGTLPELTRGNTILDLKNGLAEVKDGPEKPMANLMLKNINELGVDEKATLGAAFKAGFDRNLEDRLALLTGDEQNLITSSLARHETETTSTEAPTGESTLEALNLGEGVTMESPLNQELLTQLSKIDAGDRKDIQKVKMLSSALLMVGPDRTTEQNSSLLQDTATEPEWKKAFDLADGEVLAQLMAKLKDLDPATLLNGSLQDLVLAAEDLKSPA